MGYALHISREDEEQPPISVEEWKAVVEHDPQMRWESVYAVRNPRTGEQIQMPGHYGVWVQGEGSKPQSEIWFSYSGGTISVTNPAPEIIQKMKSLAKQLCAAVVGDEGESY